MARFSRSKSPNSTNEFPLLKALGFKTLDIDADGNCLFSALSDQVYGHTGKAFHIRAVVVKYLGDHPDEFKPFINYDGERRSPARVCARGRFSSASPTQEEIEVKINATWERYLTLMSKWGTWGDNLTIRAFACAFNRRVRVYQKDGDRDILADEERHSMVRVAYHDWRHYSSVHSIKNASDLSKHQANVKIQRVGKVEGWMTGSTASMPRKLGSEKSFKVMVDSYAYKVPKKSSSVTSSTTTSPSTSPSSPSSDSSIVQDFDSTDEKALQAPVRRRRLVARKDLNKPIIRASSPSSIYSSRSTGSSKRVLEIESSGDEPTRDSKRLRQSVPTKDIPYLSLNDSDTAFVGVTTLRI